MATRKNLAFAYMGGLTGQDLIKLRLCNILTENRDVPTPQAPAVFLCRPERPWQDESERPNKIHQGIDYIQAAVLFGPK